MSTQCYVQVGKKPRRYACEPHTDFEFWAFRVGDSISLHFFGKGKRTHAGTIKTNPEVARWLAHALLAACEADSEARTSQLHVKNDKIVERRTGSTSKSEPEKRSAV